MFDKEGITTPNGNQVPLSMIYRVFKNPFYYGEFEYPQDSGNWYKGAHEPLISKDLFEKVQEKIIVPEKSPWRSVKLDYRNVFKCGECGYNITGELKRRKLKSGRYREHVYYHCVRTPFKKCSQNKYMSQKELEDEIVRFISENVDDLEINDKLKASIVQYEKLRDTVLDNHKVFHHTKDLDLIGYAKKVIKGGSCDAKQELIRGIAPVISILDQKLCLIKRSDILCN